VSLDFPSGRSIPLDAQREGERMVELPVLRAWWDIFGSPETIEIGSLTDSWPALQWPTHPVIDPQDGIDRRCAEDPTVTFHHATVASVSTIEHIGPDYGGRWGSPQDGGAIVLQKVLQQAAHFLVSWPTGYNRPLDIAAADLAAAGQLPGFMVEQGEGRTWRVLPAHDFTIGFGHPYGPAYNSTGRYAWANGVVFVTDWRP